MEKIIETLKKDKEDLIEEKNIISEKIDDINKKIEELKQKKKEQDFYSVEGKFFKNLTWISEEWRYIYVDSVKDGEVTYYETYTPKEDNYSGIIRFVNKIEDIISFDGTFRWGKEKFDIDKKEFIKHLKSLKNLYDTEKLIESLLKKFKIKSPKYHYVK